MKKTKKEMFNEMLAIAEIASNAEMVDFINHEIELLNKKRSSNRTTAKQMENETLKAEIVSVLENAEEPMTITEITKELEGDFSNQKISALAKQLVDNGVIVKEMEKKTAKFRVDFD